MELTEDQIIQKYAKHCGHGGRKTLLSYEFEWTCIGFGYNVTKGKHELSENPRKKINIINSLKYAEHKLFCICLEVYNCYESDIFDKIFEVYER